MALCVFPWVPVLGRGHHGGCPCKLCASAVQGCPWPRSPVVSLLLVPKFLPCIYLCPQELKVVLKMYINIFRVSADVCSSQLEELFPVRSGFLRIR